MKRNMKKLACTTFAVILTVSLLTACGGSKLSGTYMSQDGFGQVFTFKGNNVTMSAFGISTTGEYEIKGDTIEITYNLFGSDYTWSQPFSKSGKTITISGTPFVKQ
ncbi:MAG: hypothetical protein IKD83_07210 [Firmicutes bacterium]|nr:hypothetical protein [Bacillota bacterium]